MHQALLVVPFVALPRSKDEVDWRGSIAGPVDTYVLKLGVRTGKGVYRSNAMASARA